MPQNGVDKLGIVAVSCLFFIVAPNGGARQNRPIGLDLA